MKLSYLTLSVSVLLFSVCFVACKEDDAPAPELEARTFSVDAKAYNTWVYFSFEKNAVVEVSDYQNDLSWDIAFHRADVRLNGGLSGKGHGSAQKTEETSLTEVLEAPAGGYVPDSYGNVIVEFKIPPVYQEQPYNAVMSTWLNIDTSSPPPVYTLAENVFVMTTVSGKYVKIKFTDYTNDKGETLYPAFEYIYQPDGSRKF